MIFSATFVVGSVAIYYVAPKVGPVVAAYLRAEGTDGEEPPESVDSGPRAPSGTPVAAPGKSPADTLPKAPDDDDLSPALVGIYPARSSESPGWGVTTHAISYYKADGSRVGTVEGGVLFDCSKMHTSSKGTMVECSFLQDGMTDGTFFIGRKDAQFFTGSHQKLSKARVRALKEYYALSGKIEARRADILERSAAMNPHFAEARKAYEAFQKNIEEAKRLEQLREKLTDVKRMELEDQLRELKLKEVGLKKTFEETQEKFTAWKKAHAPKPEDDTDIQKWTQEKKRLAPALPGLAY